MPTLEFFVVAESFSIDRQSNRLSIFNIVETLTAEEFPVVLPSMVVVTCLNLTDDELGEDFQVLLNVCSGGDSPLGGPFPTNFKAQSRRHRVIQSFQGVPFSKPGDIRFEQTLNGDHLATHLLEVKHAAPASDSPHS